jgi:hypothetical protein
MPLDPPVKGHPVERVLGLLGDGSSRDGDSLFAAVGGEWDRAEFRRQIGRLVSLGVCARVRQGQYLLAEPDPAKAEDLTGAEEKLARSVIDELIIPHSLSELAARLPRVTATTLQRVMFKLLHHGWVRWFLPAGESVHAYQALAAGIARLNPPVFELVQDDERAQFVVMVLSAVGDASVREINEAAAAKGLDPEGLDLGRRCRFFAQTGLLKPVTALAPGKQPRFALGDKGRVLADLIRADSLQPMAGRARRTPRPDRG